MITSAMKMSASSLTENMILGMNAIRCAILNGFINVWWFIGAAYYAARQFGQEAVIQDLLDEYYPTVCTCNEDAAAFSNMFGSQAEGETDYFSSCSESSMTTV